jgi:hypothetical protein
MRQVRIRVELNQGRQGMPLGKLVSIAHDTADFLISLTRDLGLESGPEHWLAEKFENGSVDFDCRLAIPIEEDYARRINSALRMVFANDYSDPATAMLVSAETRGRYAHIARPLDPDEIARFGIYRDQKLESLEWFPLTPTLAAEILEPLSGGLRSYGEIQGIVHAFFKETTRPYFKIRELSTHELVSCYFPKELYRNAIEVLADPDAVVFVEGWTTESSESGRVSEIEVTDFRLAPRFDEATYRAGLGRYPDLTGDLTTTEYIREERGE